MDMYRRISAKAGSLKLSSLQPRVKKILTITRVDNVISIYPSAEEALAAFGEPE
jgi:anti-anti-sigma factor